ncbi:MAG: membrane protein insertase YidC [Chlamydiota bacterium]
MDKRSLFFVFTLSITLLVVNLVFQQQHDKKVREWQKYEATQEIQDKDQLESDVARRTAKAEDFPIVAIYDVESEQLLSHGLLFDKVILSLSWSSEIPEKIIYRPLGQESGYNEASLAAGNGQPGSPLVYQTTPQARLKVAPLNANEIFDIQLFNTSALPLSNHVTLAEYDEGSFEIPLTPPEGLAIGLAKVENQYLPAVIYRDENFEDFSQFPYLSKVLEVSKVGSKLELSTTEKSEDFFVLENDYQQCVFSNRGGALVELNLPFRSNDNQKSIVKEIEFDRQMVQNYPYNALFPSKPYYIPGKDPKQGYTLVENRQLGGYYPLLRRDLVVDPQKEIIDIPSEYYATNIVSEYPDLARLIYKVKYFDKKKIVFEAVQSHRKITKTYSFPKEDSPYCLDLEIKIDGNSRGLWVTSGIPEVELISGRPAPSVKYRITRNQKSDVEKVSLPKDELTVTSLSPDWIANSNGFLGFIQDPQSDFGAGYKVEHVPGSQAPTRLVEIDKDYQRFKAQDFPGYNTLVPLKDSPGVSKIRLFAGPFESGTLKAIDNIYSNPNTGYNPNYISAWTFHGWFSFISEPFSKLLFVIIKFFHKVTSSWALSIILLTIVLRLLLYPLNAWSMKSMRRMQKIAPEVNAIQAKYKKDPKKSQMEVMNLYRKKKVNPFMGCLPMLIQMPFLIGMFDLLKSTFALRGATFIPGWINDLAAPDVLFSWDYPLFFIGSELHLLPILLGFVMFFQQRLSSPLPKDKNLLTDQQRQQRTMSNFMTIFFIVIFYKMPSGLNLYWLSSMLLSMGQQWLTNKSIDKSEAKNKDIEPANVKPIKKGRSSSKNKK